MGSADRLMGGVIVWVVAGVIALAIGPSSEILRRLRRSIGVSCGPGRDGVVDDDGWEVRF